MTTLIARRYKGYTTVQRGYEVQKNQRDKSNRKLQRHDELNQKIEQASILLVHKLTHQGISTLEELTIEFNKEIRKLSFLALLIPNKLDNLLKNRLNQTLKLLSIDFGPQSTVVPSDRDIKDADFENDKDLQKILTAINEGNYKVADAHELQQLLSKIPVAFISAKSNNITAIQDHEKLRNDLTEAKYSFIEIDGCYDGREKSFMVILDKELRTLSFRKFLSKIPRLIELGRDYHQDSLLIQWDAAQFYYYPDQNNPEKDRIRYGEGFKIYGPEVDKAQLPKNYYSEISQENNSSRPLIFQLYIGFAHEFNLNLFDVLCEYKSSTRFEDYYRCGQAVSSATDVSDIHPTLVLMRGVGGVNEAAMQLKAELKKQGISAVIIVGSDAHIFDLNKPNSGFKTWPQIRGEMIRRNQQAMNELLPKRDVSVIIYADMNKKIEFFKPYFDLARRYHRKVIAWQTGGGHSNFCYSARHWEDFECKGEYVIRFDDQAIIKQIVGKDNINSVVTEISNHSPSYNELEGNSCSRAHKHKPR